jgi:hypothetical protein
MKTKFFLAAIMQVIAAMSAWADGVHFTYDPGKYHAQTVIYAILTDNSGNALPDNGYYLGAFIDGKCRSEAQMESDGSGHSYFLLRVGGDPDKEKGQAITFRVYEQPLTGGPGTEYILPATQTVAFNGDATVDQVSNPHGLIFVPADPVTLPDPITIYKGKTTDLTSYITKEDYQSLPVITWTPEVPAGYTTNPYYTVEGNNITGLSATTEGASTLNYSYGGNESSVGIIVGVKATAAEFDGGNKITVAMGDDKTIGNYLTEKLKLTPGDATTTFSWASGNTEVVDLVTDATSGASAWTPKSVGQAVLTGTANDGCGLTPTLTVTVVQPITSLNASASEIWAEVGEDITDRLNALITVNPAEPTNKTYTWSLAEAETAIALENGKIVAKAITDEETLHIVTATANDGFGATVGIRVHVVAVSPKSLTAKQETIYLTNKNEEDEDCTTAILENLTLTPEGLKVSDYTLSYTSTNEEVIAVTASPASASTLNIKGSGSSTITVTLTYYDYVDRNPTDGGPTQKTLSATFTVTVQDGLGNFAFSPVVMTKEDTYKLTLAPQPEGATYDPAKLSITITPSAEMPAGWTYVESAPEGTDGLNYNLTAKSVGQGTIQVIYDGVQMGNGNISVGQRLKLTDGWQWIALHEGTINSTDELQTAFGTNLSDLRSQSQLIINDSQLGYVGDLASMDRTQAYKLRLKDVGEGGKTVDIAGQPAYFAFASGNGDVRTTRKGWNWIGNPYQYYQSLADVLADNTFTEGDIVKAKEAFATYSAANGWTGSLTHLTPGDAVLLYVQTAGTVTLKPEFSFAQQTAQQAAPARSLSEEPAPWAIDHRRFDDNMSMVARVQNVDDPSRVTLWAFVGGECRGRGVAVGDRQFITVHGQPGERVSFVVYDQLTGQFHSVYGTRTLTSISGSLDAPIPMYAGQVTAIETISATTSNDAAAATYDLGGRTVGTSSPAKGVYIRGGRKIVVK